jgi:putative flippase GtrA
MRKRRDAEASGALFNFGEASRFILTGVAATVVNLAVVWLCRSFATYQVALLFGIAAGFSVSFLMTKLFAFRSRAWKRAPAEVGRFIVVYGAGLILYWGVSVVMGGQVLPRFMPQRFAEMLGLLIGAGTMTVTGYFGHRFYTYRGASDLG